MRKKQMMAESRVDYRKICDNLKTSIYITDAQGTTLYVNDAYLECAGLEGRRDDIVGKTINEIRKANLFQCEINELVSKEKKVKNAIAYIPSSDRRLHVTGVPVFDEDGELEYILTTDRNIDELTEVENQLNQLKMENSLNRQDLEYYRSQEQDEEILYTSSRMSEVMDLIRTIAVTDVTVLITGESGTGKELTASALQKYSERRDKPFVKINCAAIPSELIESELFGYEEGAFTGAKKGGKVGAFELADGGTLLLDEIGEVPYQVQAKLLRALQEGEITRIGCKKPVKLDIRIIAATNRNLLQEVKEGKFREDLYYRLNVMPVHLPALRERREDIPLLVGSFINKFSEKYKKKASLESGAMQILKAYDWPGNIRELRNLMERLVVINRTGVITRSIIRGNLGMGDVMEEEGKTLKEIVIQTETRVILDALAECGSKRKAAAKLGVDPSTLVKKCQQYGIGSET